uniref:Putative secreted protein n=1 Tax=Ixodes ricinus TaxID=34613 RepID=A0A6B0U8D0_IXORI
MPGWGSSNGALFTLLFFNFKSAVPPSLQGQTGSGHSTTALKVCTFVPRSGGHLFWRCSPRQHKSDDQQIGKNGVPLCLRLLPAGAEDGVDPR